MAKDWSGDTPKKKKKEEEKKAAQKVVKPSSVKNVNNTSKNSTFLGGGSAVKKTENRVTVQNPSQKVQRQQVSSTPQRQTDPGTGGQRKTTYTKTELSQKAQNVTDRFNQRIGGTQQRQQTKMPEPVRRTNSARLTAAQRQKTYGTTNPTLRTIETAEDRRKERENRRTIAQAQKSGDYDRASRLRGQAQPGSLRAKAEKWDRDLSDTIEHTVKQSLAADARVINRSMQGITLKDRHLYATPEQIRKADQKVEARDTRLAKRIEDETKAIEKAQEGHGYIGKQALSAVSSTTGMGMDILAGTIVPGASLPHMWMRSTGTSLGEVNKKAEILKNQLKATGQYSDEELEEMFKNVDRLDQANALASGGIEVLSELLFPGVGAARKVIGGKGMSIAERAGAKLFNKVGEKASTGVLRNLFKGTAEEIAEEEIGGPLQSLASNLIYGNKFQGYNEDAIKRSLAEQSNALRSNVQTEDDARAAATRLSSQAFMDESVDAYMASGMNKEEATRLAELSRDYLNASLKGDVDAMKVLQDQMVKIMAGGDNSMKEKFTLQDALDAAVSTSMMTLATGAPGAISTMQIGNNYKENVGMGAIRQQTEMILNWGDEKQKNRAKSVIDHIDNGGDLSGTEVYEIIQQSAEVAEQNKKTEDLKNRVAERGMRKRDLRISPINNDGTLAPQTAQRYEQIVSSTMSRYESLARIDKGVNFDMADVELGADIGAAFETGVISAEQINELARGSAAVKTVFEDVTNIDIKQFDSYSDMRDALMTKAANNMVNSARLEQVAWNDEARGAMATELSANVGGTGDIAIVKALDTVDPRDQGKFVLTGEAARRVYEYARNTNDSWDDVKREFSDMFKGVDKSALKSVFDAAKEDKAIAENKYYGKAVKSGETINKSSVSGEAVVAEGKFTNDSERLLTGSELTVLTSVSKELGINVIMSDSLDQNENGRYSPSERTIMLNSANTMEENLNAIFSHEITHHLAAYATEDYKKLSRFVMDRWYKNDAESYNEAIGRIQKLYKNVKGQDLSPEQALEELIADASRDFWADEDFISAVTTEEPSLAKSIMNAIKDFLRKLREMLSFGNITDEPTRQGLFAEIDAYDQAYRMWLTAYNTARSERANQAIDEWQDNANKQNSPRLSVDDGKYSITTDKELKYSISGNDYMDFDASGIDHNELTHRADAPMTAEQQRDADYMQAVESNDMETAQRMVDEAAAAAMPHTKLKGRWYHGTENEFTVFNFSQGGKNGTADGYGIYLTNDPKVAESYGQRMIEGYVNVERPASGLTSQTLTDIELHRLISRTVDVEAETLMYDEGYDNAGDAKKDTWISNYTNTYEASSLDQAIDDVIKTITQFNGNDFDIIQEIMNGMGIRDYEQATAFYDILTEETGIDGLETKWGDESEMADPNAPTIALAFKSEQIKDASPVTYDDDGKPIPLSERFNTENEDIRYSLTPEQQRDADYMAAVESGNMDEAQRLVDEAALQMPNVAKATRGRMTKPLKLYHGTRYFGFTQFRDDLHDVPFIYTSTDRTVSAHYAGDQHYASTRPIGKPYREGDSIDDIIENAKTVWQTNYHVMTPDEKKARYNEVIDEAKKIADKIDELDVPFDSFADGDDYSFANAVDNVKYLFWIARDMDDEYYYNFDEDNGYREDSVQYHQDAVDGFERNIERVREYYHENRSNLSDEQKKLLSYLIGYEVGDAAIDMRSVLKVMTEEDRLMNEYGYGRVPSEMKETLDSIHNIAAYELYGDLGEKPFEFDANGAQFYGVKVPEMGDGYYSTDAICKWAYDNGYTSVIMHNIYDYGDKADNYVFFNSAQLKSADTITYAEDGSVIPLSERFDPTNNDIRYSLPTTDSDGNILTNDQMEYFKNSQARDDQGRLVPVYHTTNKGGFTIFDPSYSDDKRSLFFASNWNVSQTYGRNADRKYRFEEYSFKSLNDFAKAYAENFSNNLNDPENDILEQVVNALRIHIEKNSMPAFDLGDTMFERVKNYMKIAEAGDVRADKYRIEMKGAYGGMVRASSYDELLGKLSRQMSNNSSKSGYYECYLNLENPLIVDAQNQSWNNIPYGEYSEDAVLAIKNLTVQDMGDGIYVNIWGDRKVDGKWQEFRESDTIEFEYLTVDGEYEIPERAWDEVYDFLVKHGLSSDYAYEHSDAFFDFNGLDTFDKDGRKVESDVRRYRTRELAALADAKGYDSVIIRNCYDIGAASHLKGEGLSDIYIAFSSNQVKDINNENPTENPDIRYSTVDPDEAMSHAAHDYAYDNSYEALEHIEKMMEAATISNEDVLFNKAKSYIERDVDEFYSGLARYSNGMKFDDPILEEGRVRMAKSKQDFFNSNKAKWNDRWLTEGEVLDAKSIRKPVRDLVTAIMQDSDTDRKYKSELVDKTVIYMRLAYYYAKIGRTEIADALLWHTAHRMIDGVGFYQDDGNYETYKKLRDYFKNTRIQIGENYWNDVDYAAFRKTNYGRMNLVKGETNTDKILDDLYHVREDGSTEGIAPEYFSPEAFEKNNNKMDSPADILLQMADVLDTVQPYAEAYSSEYCAEWATDIASELLDIMQNGKELQSMADRYKTKYESKVKAMRTRHAEAMLKARQQRDKAVKAEKTRFKDYVEKQKEKRLHDKHFVSIQKSYDNLKDRLITNTADKNIPEQYKKELARLLQAFDLQTVGSKKWEARNGRKSQKSIKMAEIKTVLGNIEDSTNTFYVSDAITDIIDELIGKNTGNGYNRSIEGLTIDELNSSELARIDKLLKSLVHEFNTYKSVRVGVKRQQVADIGMSQITSALEHARIFGPGYDYNGIRGTIDRIINMDELTPSYLFRRIDPNKEGMGLMFEQLEDSHDRYIRNTVQLSEWIDEIVGEYHHKGLLKKDAGVIEEWRSENYQQTIELDSGESITLTPAQMMSVHCLAKRTQAYNHMTGNGVVVAPVSFQAQMMHEIKRKSNMDLAKPLTDADIKRIESYLTDDQMKVADELQELMSTKMAAWGNEASMNVLGIELFGEENYFPIKSDKGGLISDLSEDQFAEAIRNFGFAKAVKPGADNAIMIDDIFNVVAEHCNNMNLYNSYSEAINDFMKVYNFKDKDDPAGTTVKKAIGHAYSQKATNYIMSFIKDLNGNVSKGKSTGIDDAFNRSLARAKKASVFANIRVGLQQPTAIGRAFQVIDPKYASAMTKPERGVMDEMFEHCPIAKWKSLGYYDINMGRNIEDVIMNTNNLIEEAATWAYGALDNMTWTGIWQMCKAEVEDTHPDVEKGSDEYWDLCNRRMREVVAFTQVVDSPFHRSHAMRSKNFMDKLATAFGAEPTLTYNMVRDGYVRAYEMWKTGDKGGAAKLLTRTMSVFIFTAGLTAAASAIADVIRGKDPGDDDDEDGVRTLLEKWWSNTFKNWKENLNLLNNIYYVKDIMSLMDGWEINNLALQGWKYFALGFRQLKGDPYARSKDPWWKNIAYGLGYLSGVPVKTVMTDFGAVFNKSKDIFGFETPVLDAYLEYMSDIQIGGDDSDTDTGSAAGNIARKGMDSIAKKMGYKPVEDKSQNKTEQKKSKSDEGFLARIGIGKTEEEKAQDAREKKTRDIADKYADLSGEERDKKVWSSVTTYLKEQNEDKGVADMIANGDYSTINEYKQMYLEAGGNAEYFDERIFDISKKEMKKTIKYDATETEFNQQDRIKEYLLNNGMTEAELSDIAYKSDLAKDMKVAFRLGDKELMLETLQPLVDAGLTYSDLERLWENRNKMQLSNYKGRYKDKLKSTGKFIWPTEGTVTSEFGYRNAPTAGASTNHPAIDIGAPAGTEVVAADGGVVIYAGTNGGYGNSVGIKHDNGMVTYYNHLSAWNVKVGDTVGQGQPIAQVGSTGISTGPHLDFKILDKDGNPVDPEKYLLN